MDRRARARVSNPIYFAFEHYFRYRFELMKRVIGGRVVYNSPIPNLFISALLGLANNDVYKFQIINLIFRFFPWVYDEFFFLLLSSISV